MKRYIKRALVVLVVLVPVVGWGLKVYVSEEYQERKVSGTVVHFGDFDIDIDSLRKELGSCSADSVRPVFVQACEIRNERIIEQRSRGIVVEICNNSLYQVDYSEWQLDGYWRGRSSAYDALSKFPSPRDSLAQWEKDLSRSFAKSPGTNQISSDRVLSRGECYTAGRGGNFAPYDSLEVVITDVRLSGAPW